ncbi:MAG: serine hydrolase domain-containing protein [Halodesulfurarchaeum sp.]
MIRGLATLGLAGLSGCLRGSGADTTIPRFGDTTPAPQAVLEELAAYADSQDVRNFVATVNPPDGRRWTIGQGYLDRQKTRPVSEASLFRIASLSKPLTAAATRHLLEATDCSLEDPFLPLLDIEAPAGAPADPRLREITIRQLLQHRGGWDRIETFDPIFEPWRVCWELGIAPPPTAQDYARFVLDRELSFTPGTDSQYSNVGYLFLGLVIEAVSGRPYQTFLQETVFERAGIEPADIQPGRTRPAFRPDRETFYDAEYVCLDLTSPQYLRLVPCPDGGFPEEAMTAVGGHVATATAYDQFMQHYDLDGRPHEGEPAPEITHGSKRGTRAMAYRPRRDLSVVVFSNRRTEEAEPLRAAIEEGVSAAGL